MGYTHYWTTKKPIIFSKEEWDNLKETARIIFKECKAMNIKLCYDENNKSSSPRANNIEIVFNGFKNLSHETFILTPIIDGFNFCKTERKPYDIAVTALLIYIQNSKHPDIKVSSDGDNNDWIAGLNLLHKADPGIIYNIPENL